MSWLDKVKNQLTITCGDGESYTPNYLNPQKAIDYNFTEFLFPNIDGTLVVRYAPKGRRYPVEFYFQGEEHLDTAAAFETSAADRRPWTVSHPLYGELTVQPVSLNFDNTEYNVTKITGVLLETIEKPRPSVTASPVDQVIDDKITADAVIAEAYAEQVTPTATDVAEMQMQNQVLYAEGKGLATGSEGNAYFNAFNTAYSAISSATAEPLAAMNAIQQMISAPARFAASVKERMNTLETQFNRLVETVENLLTPNQKRQFQAAAGTMMTTMSENAVTGEYQTSSDVLSMVEAVSAQYEEYITSLDALQTANAGDPESYVPDQSALLAIDALVNSAVSNLFDIALDAQQERSIILEHDSNAVVLAHRFYGLDAADENLERFIETNNLSFNEYVHIKKGTRIIYYV